MNIISILKIVIKNIWLCQRCANLSAYNLKIEVTDRISERFIRGKALQLFFPPLVAKNIVLITVFCFVCKLTFPCKNSVGYVGMDKTVTKLF